LLVLDKIQNLLLSCCKLFHECLTRVVRQRRMLDD
jgi:hypothetical protein